MGYNGGIEFIQLDSKEKELVMGATVQPKKNSALLNVLHNLRLIGVIETEEEQSLKEMLEKAPTDMVWSALNAVNTAMRAATLSWLRLNNSQASELAEMRRLDNSLREAYDREKMQKYMQLFRQAAWQIYVDKARAELSISEAQECVNTEHRDFLQLAPPVIPSWNDVMEMWSLSRRIKRWNERHERKMADIEARRADPQHLVRIEDRQLRESMDLLIQLIVLGLGRREHPMYGFRTSEALTLQVRAIETQRDVDEALAVLKEEIYSFLHGEELHKIRHERHLIEKAMQWNPSAKGSAEILEADLQVLIPGLSPDECEEIRAQVEGFVEEAHTVLIEAEEERMARLQEPVNAQKAETKAEAAPKAETSAEPEAVLAPEPIEIEATPEPEATPKTKRKPAAKAKVEVGTKRAPKKASTKGRPDKMEANDIQQQLADMASA